MPFVGEKGCAVCRLAENLVNFNISYEFNDKRNMPSVHSTRKKLNPPPSQTAKVQVLAIQGQAGSDESSSYEQRILTASRSVSSERSMQTRQNRKPKPHGVRQVA